MLSIEDFTLTNLFSIFPNSLVYQSIFHFDGPVPMLLAIIELSFIYSSIRIIILTISFHYVIQKISPVFGTVSPNHSPISLNNIILKLTFILARIWESYLTIPIFLSIYKTPQIFYIPFYQNSIPVNLIVFPIPRILVIIAVIHNPKPTRKTSKEITFVITPVFEFQSPVSINNILFFIKLVNFICFDYLLPFYFKYLARIKISIF